MISDEALIYGCRFAGEFYQRTHGSSAGEIGLFRKMMDALTAAGGLGSGVKSAEIHGNSHQVRFVGPGGYSRVNARCELADVMVVAFSPHSNQARLSFIQAKSERNFGIHTGIVGRKLRANLEQWDLLSRRPEIKGVGAFNPPPSLLSGATRRSVGSFVFFVKDGRGGYDIYYASAARLPLGGRYTQRNGSLLAQDALCTFRPGGGEAHSMVGAFKFGVCLADLLIGASIGPKQRGAWGGSVNRFIAQQVRRAMRNLGDEATEQQVELSRSVERLLDPDNRDADDIGGLAPAFGARSLLLIQTSNSEDVRQ